MVGFRFVTTIGLVVGSRLPRKEGASFFSDTR